VECRTPKAGTLPVMTTTPPQALLAYLQSIPQSLQSPIFPQLLKAAPNVQNAQQADVLHALLGAAGSFGSDIPTQPLTFPADHALHINMGTEWYWFSANLEVDGSEGLDKIGVLVLMTRNRAVSNALQPYDWGELDAQVVDTCANVTVATREACFIARRTPNTQWPAMGGSIEISAPGQPFVFACGPDSFRGGAGVLPLAIQVNDGTNLTIDLQVTSDLPVESAFFLQGKDGLTTGDRPGLYYSWPQLSVQGTVSAGGKSYSVHGKGWIDHQLMMTATNAPAPAPLPPPSAGFAPIAPCSGWSWCQFNLDNGDAITVAAFQAGTLRTEVLVPYGFYVRAEPGGWAAIPLLGSLAVDRFVPGIFGVLNPSAWTYQLTDWAGGSLVDVEVLPVPWYPDGSFASSNLSVYGETAVSVAMINHAPLNAQAGPGIAVTGAGYCESVGYEPLETYWKRGLAFLGES
jgi:CrtC N-terminal lipocalin domain